MRIWLAIAAVAIGTYLMRASLILVMGRITLAPRVERALRYIAPAVLGALIGPAFVAAPGLGLALVPALLAAAVGTVLAWRFRTIPAVLVGGLATFHLADWVIGLLR